MTPERDIAVLRIRLDRTGSGPARAVFDLHTADSPLRDAGAVFVGELGLPDVIRSSGDIAEDRFDVPAGLVERIGGILRQLRPDPAIPLWLELAAPHGYLHLVPWEQLLSRPLGRMLLRLPNVTVPSTAAGPSLRIALFASEPQAKSPFSAMRVLPKLARCWRDSTSRPTYVHVFADLQAYPRVLDELEGLDGVVVADPAHAQDLPSPPRSSGPGPAVGDLTNPWLRWISAELAGTAVDVVHFAGHGYLTGDQGCLALATTPTRNDDERIARFVAGAELAEFMCRTGAWSLCLSSPPHNYSVAALRELADATAQVRPGVTVLHDLACDDDLQQLADIIGTVFGGTLPPRALPAVTCWSSPELVEHGGIPSPRTTLESSVELSFDAGAYLTETRDVLAQDTTPTWVASGARILEATQVEWTGPGGSLDDPDAIAALRRVSALFNEHVRDGQQGDR